MIIKNNSVEQINIALLELENNIKKINNSNDLNIVKNKLESVLRSLNETKNGLESGGTYNINITGHSSTSSKSDNANYADTAYNATISEKDMEGNIISSTYQKISEKNSVAGYSVCNKTSNGVYFLSATVDNGVISYDWIMN